jgi:hypothetical protein
MEPLEKITVLDNEVEARLLQSLLNEREIPHVIVSYHDAALDGLFQASRGWGHVEAPSAYKEEVTLVLNDLRSGPTPEEDASQ